MSPRERIIAITLAGAMTLGSAAAIMRPPDSAQAHHDSPDAHPDVRLEMKGLTVSPLIERDGLSPEALITIGGPVMNAFDSPFGTQIVYESTPPEGFDGIYPQQTVNFVNTYLRLDTPLTTTDLTWNKISTDLSESMGLYLTMSGSTSDKLDDLVAPDSFDAMVLYSNRITQEKYLEVKVPDANVGELSTEEDYFALMKSALKIPELEIPSGVGFGFLEVPVGIKINQDGRAVPESIDRDFVLTFPNGEDSAIIMANPHGNIYVLETDPGNLFRILQIATRE